MGDVVIIGAGIIGSAVALELQKRGISTLLLEKAVPGAESSSAAAGMLAPQMECSQADPGFELGLVSRGLYRAWVEELRERTGDDVGYHVDGALRPVTNEAELLRLESSLAWQKERGLRVEHVDRASLVRMVPGIRSDVVGALFFPDEGQVDPRLLMFTLSRATASKLCTTLSGATVRRIVVEAGRVCAVELSDRIIKTSCVVIAAGAWSTMIEGGELPRDVVKPARGQMIALDAGQVQFLPYVWTSHGYVVPRRDGRILVGATVELVGYDKSVTAGGMHSLLTAALELVPSLAGARVAESWAGLRPWTRDHLPIIGPTPIEGLHLATGHYRNGILQAPATARLIAQAIAGEKTSVDLAPFSVERFR